MASIKQLFTRADSNKVERIKVGQEPELDEKGEQLKDDKGKLLFIDHWLDYLGTDSDAFREAKREMQKLIMAGDLSADDSEAFLLSSLIVDWSFDEECTDENKQELLRESPALAESLDRAASRRANFTKRLSATSTTTPKDGNGSRSRKTQKTKTQ